MKSLPKKGWLVAGHPLTSSDYAEEQIVFDWRNILAVMSFAANAFAGDADINLPDLTQVTFPGVSMGGHALLFLGLAICAVGALFGVWEFMPVPRAAGSQGHEQRLQHDLGDVQNVSVRSRENSSSLLWVLIAACIVYYFWFLQHKAFGPVLVILASSVLGILGSYGVAWFGIRINTYANSRAAFASLRGNSLQTLLIPLPFGHEHRPAAGLRGTGLHDRHPAVHSLAPSPARASSVSPSANRLAPRRCASAAASSPRLPTSAPT